MDNDTIDMDWDDDLIHDLTAQAIIQGYDIDPITGTMTYTHYDPILSIMREITL